MKSSTIRSLLIHHGVSALESKHLADHIMRISFHSELWKKYLSAAKSIDSKSTNRNTSDRDFVNIPQDVRDVVSRIAFLRQNKQVPLSYIIGEQPFWNSSFTVRLPEVDFNDPFTVLDDSYTAKTLIPRSDSEVVVEACLKFIKSSSTTAAMKSKRKIKVLDIATGSGCLLLSILAEGNEGGKSKQMIEGVGIDIDDGALTIARLNAKRILGSNWKDKCLIVKGDMTNSISVMLSDTSKSDDSFAFDFIMSNPPYILSEVIPTLDNDVKLHEPFSALDGGTDGNLFYKAIAKRFQDYPKPLKLNQYGYLLLEIGQEQNIQIMKEIFQEIQGLTYIDTIKDNFGKGNDRLVIFQQQ